MLRPTNGVCMCPRDRASWRGDCVPSLGVDIDDMVRGGLSRSLGGLEARCWLDSVITKRGLQSP